MMLCPHTHTHTLRLSVSQASPSWLAARQRLGVRRVGLWLPADLWMMLWAQTRVALRWQRDPDGMSGSDVMQQKDEGILNLMQTCFAEI